MKLVFKYLKEKRAFYIIAVLFCIVFMSVAVLYSEPAAAYFYSFELCLVFLIIYFIIDYRKFAIKHRNLKRYMKMEHIYKFGGVDNPGPVDEEYAAVINKLIDDRCKLESAAVKSQNELKDYYAMWAHQIKTPISAIDLMLQVMQDNPGEINVSDIKQEMFKIDFYVDAVMNYLRLEDMSSDFNFVKASADKIVKKAVKKFSKQFINKHISIELGSLDKQVITDEKWLGFIIEQLLSNSIKYTNPGGRVRIYFKDTFNINDRILVIEDNGIGISKEDLPRIMERGYTGYNGRMDKKSSGIGLYLCSKASRKLGCELQFESEPDKGTKVNINITQKHTLHE